MAYSNMEFIEAPAFTRYLPEYLDDEQYRRLQNELADNPEAGDVISGTGGFRKLRWADKSRGKDGERAIRTISYFYSSGKQLRLWLYYIKVEPADQLPVES